MKKKKPGRKPRMPNRTEFIMLYQNPSITADELALHYKVKKKTIYNWAWKIRNEEKNA